MIGNLKSTFVIDALLQLNKLVFELEYLRKNLKFEIVIIGKFKERKKYKNLLNKEWIKFKGWENNVDRYFVDSIALLVPSKNKLSVRTKILDAFPLDCLWLLMLQIILMKVYLKIMKT